MRRLVPLAVLGVVLLALGCNNTRWNFLNNPNKRPEDIRVPPNAPPMTVASLVSYLNYNAQLMQSLRCEDLNLTCTDSHRLIPQSIDLRARMVCQQPRNFRLGASFLGSDQVDMGSNDEEFWYWIKKGDNAQVHCSYKDLAAGNVKAMPFPFQPDWVLETLGMSNYGPPERWELDSSEADKVKLIEHTRSPQGKPLSKVIVFRRQKMQVPAPQVTDFLLIDEGTRAVICSAPHVTQVQTVSPTGAVLPRVIDLNWPAEKVRLGMRLDTVTANVQFPPNSPAFVRRPLAGVRSIDLATLNVQPSSLQRTGGVTQR